MNQKNLLQNLISAKDKVFFIGTKNLKTNRYSSPVTSELFAEELIKLCQPIEGKQNHYNIDLSDILNEYTENIKNFITQENDKLIEKLIDYDLIGVIRNFSGNFTRIKEGRLSEDSPLYLELEKLLGIHKEILLKTSKKKYIGNHPQNKRWVLNISEVEKNFDKLIIILVMNIFINFNRKDNEKYFAEDRLYSKDIADIKQYLEEMINKDDLENLLIYNVCIKKNSALLDKYNTVFDENTTKLDLYQNINFNHDHNWENNLHSFTCTVSYYDDDEHHYSKLLDCLNLINYIDFIYKGLIDSCLNDMPEHKYEKEIILLIEGKGDLSSLNTNLLTK